jgi:hypothetical protein
MLRHVVGNLTNPEVSKERDVLFFKDWMIFAENVSGKTLYSFLLSHIRIMCHFLVILI